MADASPVSTPSNRNSKMEAEEAAATSTPKANPDLTDWLGGVLSSSSRPDLVELLGLYDSIRQSVRLLSPLHDAAGPLREILLRVLRQALIKFCNSIGDSTPDWIKAALFDRDAYALHEGNARQPRALCSTDPIILRCLKNSDERGLTERLCGEHEIFAHRVQ